MSAAPTVLKSSNLMSSVAEFLGLQPIARIAQTSKANCTALFGPHSGCLIALNKPMQQPRYFAEPEDLHTYAKIRVTAHRCIDMLDLPKDDPNGLSRPLLHVPFPKILSLNLSKQPFSSIIPKIKKYPEITGLDLSDTDITEDQLAEILRVCPLLQALLLINCKQLTDKIFVQCLNQLKCLRTLILDGCVNITDNGLAALVSEQENLEQLSLKDCRNITDTGLAYLAKLKQLTNLILSGCDKVTDRGVLFLSPLEKLQQLSLKNCYQITNDAFEKIAPHLKDLRSLDLSWCQNLTDHIFEAFGSFVHLQGLNFMNPSITDIGLKCLSQKLKELQYLTLDFSSITDIGIGYLSSFEDLMDLSLNYCMTIKGSTINRLSKTLKTLSISFAQDINPSAIKAIRKVRPNLIIINESPGDHSQPCLIM